MWDACYVTQAPPALQITETILRLITSRLLGTFDLQERPSATTPSVKYEAPQSMNVIVPVASALPAVDHDSEGPPIAAGHRYPEIYMPQFDGSAPNPGAVDTLDAFAALAL